CARTGHVHGGRAPAGVGRTPHGPCHPPPFRRRRRGRMPTGSEPSRNRGYRVVPRMVFDCSELPGVGGPRRRRSVIISRIELACGTAPVATDAAHPFQPSSGEVCNATTATTSADGEKSFPTDSGDGRVRCRVRPDYLTGCQPTGRLSRLLPWADASSFPPV